MSEPEQSPSKSKSRWVCEVEGCNNGLETGHALHRISPKGEAMPFRGRCSEHAPPEMVDDVADLIERHNHGRGT